MPNKLTASTKGAGLFFKRNWQIAYAVLLILLVPASIVFNTMFVVNRFRTTIDLEMQRSALMMGNMFAVTSSEFYADAAKLQERLQAVAIAVPEAKMLDVIGRDGEDFKIIASLNTDVIGKPAHGSQNMLAWYNNKAIAYLTKTGRSAAVDDKLTVEEVRSELRYAGFVMPLAGPDGKPMLLLSAKFSMAGIDNIVMRNLTWSYLWLLITVLIVILLLAANSRLFEYALLFRKLKEVDRMKDDFISMASHELRSPITAIRGYLSLFLEDAFGATDDKQKGVLKTTFAIATHLAGLVEDLLDVSRIEQGRMSISYEVVHPEEIVAEIMEQLKFEAEKKNLILEFRHPSTPLPAISVDRSRLRQVLINLISNSIKYTPKGTVTVSADKHDGQMVEIKITDTGLGMSAEAREKLFEKFYRIRTDDTRDIQGTGLGLWITKQIVELMKGHIYVDSIEKVGTQASVVFPAIIEVKSTAASTKPTTI